MNERNKVYDVVKPFYRRNALPLDESSLFFSYDSAYRYAKGLDSNKSAYIGQVVSVVEDDESGKTVTVYKVVYDPEDSGKTLSRIDDVSLEKIEDLRETLTVIINEYISYLESGLTDTNERVSVLESGLTDTNVRIDNLEDDLSDTNDELDGLSEEVFNYEEITNAALSAITEALENINTSIAQNDPIVVSEESIRDVPIGGKRMSVVFDMVAGAIRYILETIDQHEGTLDNHEERIAELESGLTEVTSELEDLGEDTYRKEEVYNKEEINSLLSGLEPGVEVATKEDINRIDNELSALTADVETAKSDIDDLNEELSALTADVETAKSDIDDLNEELSSVKDDVEGLQDGVENLNDEVSGITTDIATIKEDIEDIYERIEEAMSNVPSGLTEEIEDIKDSIADLYERIDSGEDIPSGLTEDIEYLKSAVEDLYSIVGEDILISGMTLSEVIQDILDRIDGLGTGTMSDFNINGESVVEDGVGEIVIEGDGDIRVDKSGNTITISVMGISNEVITLS